MQKKEKKKEKMQKKKDIKKEKKTIIVIPRWSRLAKEIRLDELFFPFQERRIE